MLAGLTGLLLVAALAQTATTRAPPSRRGIRSSTVATPSTMRPAERSGRQEGGYALGEPAESFRMQATDLGRYLLYGLDADFLAVDGDAIAPAAQPSDNSDWTVREAGGGAFTIVNTFVDRGLGVDGGEACRHRRDRGRAAV